MSSLLYVRGLKTENGIKKILLYVPYAFILLIYSTADVSGVLNEPFPTGYAMQNFGTVIQANRISGRQPWNAACFARDSARMSLALSYVDYYDAMDNLTDEHIRQTSFGIWFPVHRFGIKCAFTLFDALDIYYERSVFISLGIALLPWFQYSTELHGHAVGLYTDENESETVAFLGFSCWFPLRYTSISLSCKNIPIKKSLQNGFAPQITFCAGVHTMPHRFGSQGICVSVEPMQEDRFHFYIGEEYYVYKTLALNFGISVNPVMIGLGLTLSLPRYSAYSAFVHHTVLGWSQGIGMEYVRLPGR